MTGLGGVADVDVTPVDHARGLPGVIHKDVARIQVAVDQRLLGDDRSLVAHPDGSDAEAIVLGARRRERLGCPRVQVGCQRPAGHRG